MMESMVKLPCLKIRVCSKRETDLVFSLLIL